VKRKTWRTAGWAVLAAAAVAASALAQTEGGGAAPDYGGLAKGGMSLSDLFRAGGVCMYPLTALSIVGVWFVIYLFIVLRPAQVVPPALYHETLEHLRGGRPADARRACGGKPTPFATVTLAALEYVERVAAPNPALLKDVIEGEGLRQAEQIQGPTQYLLDIAVVAPMVGLLGTVFGMMRAFGSIANDIASAKPIVIAAGVSEALITTAYGLIIGIPAMAFYAYFRRRSADLVSRLESAATDVLTALTSARA